MRAVRGTAAGVAGAVSLPPPLSQHHVTASCHSTMSGGTAPARAGLLSSHTGCSTLPSARCQLNSSDGCISHYQNKYTVDAAPLLCCASKSSCVSKSDH